MANINSAVKKLVSKVRPKVAKKNPAKPSKVNMNKRPANSSQADHFMGSY